MTDLNAAVAGIGGDKNGAGIGSLEGDLDGDAEALPGEPSWLKFRTRPIPVFFFFFLLLLFLFVNIVFSETEQPRYLPEKPHNPPNSSPDHTIEKRCLILIAKWAGGFNPEKLSRELPENMQKDLNGILSSFFPDEAKKLKTAVKAR